MTLTKMVAELNLDASGFVRGASQATAAQNSLMKSVDSTSDKWNKAGDKMMGVGKKLTLGVTAPLLGIAAMGIKTAASFEESMNVMGAVAGVPGPELEKLRALAIKVGQDTVFSANEAAQAQVELAKAGVSTADILAGALKNGMDLAAAGGLEVAEASSIMANAMNTFNISGAESVQVADALAGAAAASSADVRDLALGLAQVGLVANASGLSIQETTAALAAMANAGLSGSDAGTSFKTMLMNLQPITKKQIKLMDELDLSFVNADGSFKSLTEIAGLLKDRLGSMSEAQRLAALETIFGSDAVRAATVLMNEGAEGIQGYIDQTSKVGTAWEQAKARMEGLPGAIERLKGSLETAALALGEVIGPWFEKLGGWVEDMANKFTEADPATQKMIVALGVFAAAIGPVLIGLGAMALAFAALSANPFILVVAGIVALIGVLVWAYFEFETFRNIVNAVGSGIALMFTGMVGIVQGAIGLILAILATMVSGWLSMAGGILAAADLAFGWIPGVGDKISAARAKFDDFAAGVNGGMQTARDAVANFGSTADAELMRVKQDLDIVEATDPDMRLTVTDQATGPIAMIKSDLDIVEGTNPTPVVTATDGGSVGRVQSQINSVQGKTVYISVGVLGLQTARNALMAPLRHTGGAIMHDGGPITRMHDGGIRRDERLILAQAGEFMMQRSAVQNWGMGNLAYMNANAPKKRGGDGGSAPSYPSVNADGRIELTITNITELDGTQISRSTRTETLRTARANTSAYGRFAGTKS